MKYHAVLFDFDYTLGDATQAIYAGFCHAFETMGLPRPDVEAVRHTVGLVVTDGYTHISGDASEAGRRRFYELFHPVARDLQAKGVVELLPGAVELLDDLRGHGVRLAVVSSKHAQSLRAVFDAKGISDRFDLVIGGGDVASHKPDPEGLLLALDRLGAAPGEALYCGDTVIDAETAQRSGTPFCAVLNGTTPASAFEVWPTVHVAPDLPDLHAWLKKEGTL